MALPRFLLDRRGFLAGASTLAITSAASLNAATQEPDSSDGPTLRPEMFGAMGDGRDDTPGLRAMVAAANRAGSAHVVFAPGKTYLLSHERQQTLHFKNLTALRIEGRGATLKTAQRGCPAVSLGHNWGQVNVENCRNVEIVGLTFDGNRGGQLHTKGRANGFGFNAGVNFWSAESSHRTSDVRIYGCTFRDHGTLTASTDVRGDGIIARSGVRRMTIEDCRFERCGRWAFALAEGREPSEHVYFRRNVVHNENRAETGNRPWGAVDIEDVGLPNRHIYIEDNIFSGTAQVAYGGFGGDRREVLTEDIFIRRNVWDIPAGASATNVPFALGFSSPANGTYREMRRLYVEDNVVRWRGPAQTTHIGHSAKLRDLFVRRNTFQSDQPTARADSGVVLGYSGHIEGRIEISDNRFIGLGEALANATWFADPTPSPLDLVIERNLFDNCYRAFNLQFVGIASPPARSRVLIQGNSTRRTRAPNGEYIDGGSLRVNLLGKAKHDNIWQHRNVNYPDGI